MVTQIPAANANLAAALLGQQKQIPGRKEFKMFSTLFSDKERAYTGSELSPHFILSRFGVKGSAIIAFAGACSVKTEHLVDWEDRLANDKIEAKKMVHFLGEFFGMSLKEGVLLQRLFMASLAESLAQELGVKAVEWGLKRDGDDVFVKDRKLSVSIVTASPVSVLLHAGINIDPAGAPVPAIGLDELKVDYKPWVEAALQRFQSEWESMDWACAKVRPVM